MSLQAPMENHCRFKKRTSRFVGAINMFYFTINPYTCMKKEVWATKTIGQLITSGSGKL